MVENGSRESMVRYEEKERDVGRSMTWFPAIFILRLFVAFAIDSAVYVVCGLVWGGACGDRRAIFVCKVKLSNLAEKSKTAVSDIHHCCN